MRQKSSPRANATLNDLFTARSAWDGYNGPYPDTAPTNPRGVPIIDTRSGRGPVTSAIDFGNQIPTRTVKLWNWTELITALVVGAVFGFMIGVTF